MKKTVVKCGLILVIIALFAGLMYACTPYTEVEAERYPILDDEANEANKDHTTKDEAIDLTCNSMTNLLDYLDSDIVSTTGYYVGADIAINTENNDAFILKMQANLYTYPYELKDENGNTLYDKNGKALVDEEALKIHNELIKQNDIVLEWYDGMTNTMLIGFYFDGINPNSADPGNNLYLNLQGSKRIFPKFGDSVLYQQIVRLITQFNLASVMGSAAGGTSNDAVETIRTLLETTITSNYKKVINNDISSIFYDNVSLSIVADDITSYMQDFFSPFSDKIDPLTKKYLGFSFWTLGNSSISGLASDMQYFVSPASTETLDKEILSGVVVDLTGTAAVAVKGKDSDNNAYVDKMLNGVAFTSRMSFEYSIRTSSNIVIDKSDYTIYEYGCYEYIGELFIPYLDLKMDALIRTDIQETDNPNNDIFMQFRDQADDKLLIGMYYDNELTYLDISGLEDLYGGIKFEDIGLPKAYKDGINVAELLEWLFDTIDQYIVFAVDELLAPSEGSEYDNLTKAIMDNMESTEKTDDDPTSRNTIAITVDIELIRLVLKETSENGTEYTNEQMIDIINQEFNIDLDEIAAILGMNVEQLIETTFFKLTYDVDDYSIIFDLYSTMDIKEGEDAYLVLTLDVMPTHIGEKVKIVFPSFDNFNKLKRVYTYSGYMEGEFIFASTEEVDLSELMGAFIGDLSGKNTQYILPESASIYFTMYYDQYIREQILENGRWTRSGRSAFNIYFYTIVEDERVDLFRVYANDVAFDTSKPVDEFNYVWVDLLCVEGMPKMKIREDLFIESFNQYMGEDVSDDEATVTGLTRIVQALLEDSWPVFEPDVIRITTSNQTIKDFFRVDELIATVSVQIGFTQRVFNIDELESSFAMYTVGEFDDMTGTSPYEVELHPTVTIYFDFGTRVETREFKFNYKKSSITIPDTNTKVYTYYPEIDGRFMGVTRNYQLVITGGDRGASKIDNLVENSVVWEPLDDLPTTAVATYGNDSAKTYAYNAIYEFFGTYDKDLDLYVVQNDYGYDIVYDYKSNVYIVGLGTNAKMNKIYNVLSETDTILLKNYVNASDVEMLYDLKSGFSGYYVVITDRCKVLYNAVTDVYVILSEDDRANAEILAGDGATIVTYNRAFGNYVMRYEFSTGYYVVNSNDYAILYDPAKDVCYIENAYDLEVVREFMVGKEVKVVSDGSIKWDAVNWNRNLFSNSFDWGRTYWNNLEWNYIYWDDITLEGGKFIMRVTIGRGMMATYTELINVKVTNRVVDTDKYVNINTEGGKVKAPVADYVDVDPYVYILLKADYYNNLSELLRSENFVKWFFEQYSVTIGFTDIYFNADDTPDEVGSFAWSFDYANDMSIYSEKDINNLVAEGATDITYIYTVFKKQVIALGLYIQPRTIDYIMIDGETQENTYTVDSLLEETYVIPQNPTIYFVETDANGNPYTLNFSDYSPEASTIFANSIWTVSDKFYSTGVKSNSSYARENVVVWSDPAADNFMLDWGDNPVRPFKRTNTDTTTSFIDIRNHVDPLSKWFDEDWFTTPIISVKVLMPNKVVETLTYTEDGDDYEASNIKVQEGAENGRFYVDPYDASTWVLPDTVTVVFRNSATETYESSYTISWADNVRVDVTADGKFVLNGITADRSHFILDTKIGNDTIGYIHLKLLVTNMSGIVQFVEYLDENGAVVAGDLANAPENGATYVMKVDTYSRFDMPTALRIKFIDGTVRTYDAAWGDHAPWAPGTWVGDVETPNFVDVDSLVGDITKISTNVTLTFEIEARIVDSISFLRADGTREFILIDIENKTIGVSGFVVQNDKIYINDEVGYLAPYEYLRYLFGEVEVTFVTHGTANPVMIYDTVESAIYDIYREFDTQEVRLVSGQQFTVYLGQGAGADDYTVTLKAAEADKIIAGQIVFSTIQPYDIEAGANIPNYADGYVIGDELALTVIYATAGERTFEKGSFYNWVVGRPDVLTGEFASDLDFEGLNGEIYSGMELTTISWSAILGGGYVWVSTMIDDSSRVFVRLFIGGIDIGSNYDSAPTDTSRFEIKQGVITIKDVYSFYPFYSSVTAAALPRSIKCGDYIIPGITWTLTIDIATLDAINYTTDETYELARATVIGEEIVLYLKILPCVIVGVDYVDPTDITKNFDTGTVNSFNFDAYKNTGYNGNFTLPSNITVKFQAGGEHSNTDTQYTVYKLSSGSFEVVEVIPYVYSGHTLADTLYPEKVILRITMDGDGQTYDFTVNFNNKTVISITAQTYDEAFLCEAGLLTLDPYKKGVYVTDKVIVKFAQGDDLEYKVSWTIPTEFYTYGIKYNTYNDYLIDHDGVYVFTAKLSSTGLADQNLTMNVAVLDRELTSWTLAGYADTEASVSDPNALYHYSDPFAGRASNLPNNLADIVGGTYGQVDLTDIDIVWSFADGDISADGTYTSKNGKYGSVITGYLGSAEYGQKFTIRVYVDRWEFAAIRKPQGDGYIIMNEEIRFYFSRLTDVSAYSNYQIVFTVTDYSSNTPTRYSYNRLFYPSDVTAPAGNENYVLRWNNETKAAARNSSQAVGYFYLTNAQGRDIITPSQTAYYQYETLYISEIDLGYGYGADNYAIYVVNSLNPIFNLEDTSNNYVSTALAKGTKNQQYDQDLGEVTVHWPTEPFADTYLKGGIYRGYTVTLDLKVDGVVIYTQEFNIMLVFLDMSPTAALEIHAGETAPTTFATTYRNSYTTATYSGAINPYRESYTAGLIDALNTALITLNLNTDNSIIFTNIVWAESVPTSVVRDTVIYSSRVSVSTVAGRYYYVSAIKLIVHP